jgi:hypothetical protein
VTPARVLNALIAAARTAARPAPTASGSVASSQMQQERISILRRKLSERGGHLRTERLGLDPV